MQDRLIHLTEQTSRIAQCLGVGFEKPLLWETDKKIFDTLDDLEDKLGSIEKEVDVLLSFVF